MVTTDPAFYESLVPGDYVYAGGDNAIYLGRSHEGRRLYYVHPYGLSYLSALTTSKAVIDPEHLANR